MGLDEQVGLDVRVVVPSLGQLEGHAGSQLPQKRVFFVADGDTFVLGSGRQDLKETFQFGLVVERHTEQLWNREGYCIRFM